MIISNEQFRAAYEKLPFTIREYLAGDELGEVTSEIGKLYGLHIDTIGALEREVTNMLLGIINPEQFVSELKSIGIPQESIGTLVKELNAKVFMPLREKMQNTPEEEPEAVEAEGPEPTPAPVVVQYAPAQTPPTSSVAPSAVPSASPIPPRPVPPAPSAYVPPYVAPTPAAPVPTFREPIPTPPLSVSSTNPQLRPTPYSPVTENVHLAARTMAQDMEDAQKGRANPSMQKPEHESPAQNTWTPASTPAPTNQASVTSMPKMPISNPPPTATPIPPQQSENRDALHAVLKGYGIDPYREPPA